MPDDFRCTGGRSPKCVVPFMACMLSILLLFIPAASLQAQQAVTDTAAADTVDPGGSESREEETPEDVNPNMVITLKKKGEIVIELLPEEAPLAVERIMALVKEGFYDGVKFHRVISYLVQAGRKECDLPPVEGEMFAQNLKHTEGMVGMARLPDDYDSATTQFYIMKEYRSRLNCEYTLFGRVVSGMDLVQKIKKGDKIESIRIKE